MVELTRGNTGLRELSQSSVTYDVTAGVTAGLQPGVAAASTPNLPASRLSKAEMYKQYKQVSQLVGKLAQAAAAGASTGVAAGLGLDGDMANLNGSANTNNIWNGACSTVTEVDTRHVTLGLSVGQVVVDASQPGAQTYRQAKDSAAQYHQAKAAFVQHFRSLGQVWLQRRQRSQQMEDFGL